MDAALPLRDVALFLDLEGTLIETPSVGETGRETECVQLLRRLGEAMHGRVAVLSGQRIRTVDRMVQRMVMAVAGRRGLERRTAAGDILDRRAQPALAAAHDVLEALATATPGLRVVRLGPGVAVRYGGAPRAKAAVLETVHRLARATGLDVRHGRAVAELRMPGPGKGAALRSFMREAPFRGATPVVLGDGLADEPAFRAAAHLGGWSILVGAPRESDAHFRLPRPAAARAWLDRAVETGWFDLGAAPWVA